MTLFLLTQEPFEMTRLNVTAVIPRHKSWIALLGCFFLSQTIGLAQVDESDDLPAGLLGTYQAGDKTVERIDSGVSFIWKDAAPDARLVSDKLSVEWRGVLLVQQPGTYRLHTFVAGKVDVQLDGTSVVAGESATAKWISGDEFSPELGLRELSVRFEKRSDASEVHLFWSSDAFPLEPLPAHLLFREGGRPDLAEIERGRQLVESHRCARCHLDEKIPQAATAPDLTRSVAGLPNAEIQKRLTAGHGGAMPLFGFEQNQAAAVATYLQSTAEKPDLQSLPKAAKGRSDEQDRADGATLVRSLGCLACHKFGETGEPTTFSGGDLAQVAQRRSAEWVFTWLSDPEKLNRDHRMPVFSLSNNEKRQLALALAKPAKQQAKPAANDADVVLGKRLVAEARCVACHRINGLDDAAKSAPLHSLTKLQLDSAGDNSCLSEKADRTKSRPAFPKLDRKAVTAYLKSISGAPSQTSPFDRGRQLLISRNCVACHPRESFRGLVATAGAMARTHEPLQGQAPKLVPPNLTAVGDKLLDEALTKSIAGEQKRRMDWLFVRMPKFKHSDADAKAITTYLIGHDRIPDSAPTWDKPEPTSKPDDQTLLIGQELVGAKGWSCIACHQVGEYVPQKTIVGTRGSDLVGLGERMRYSYYLRWTRSPLRIVPGVEMPSYTRPVKHVLDEDVDRQLETLWQTLADPRFEPPTNPASVEQFLVVAPDSPAQIVRDVFTNPEENGGGAIARAFAVGFNNGHSLLIDLDTLTLRRWTFGDFARQRTIGKSWYWDMAGSDIVAGLGSSLDTPARSNYALVKSDVAEANVLDASIAPRRENNTNGRLLSYAPYADGIRFRYVLEFELNGKQREVSLEETLRPAGIDGESRSGWTRDVVVRSIPAGYDLVMLNHAGKVLLGQPTSIETRGPDSQVLTEASNSSSKSLGLNLRLKPENGAAETQLRYTAALERTPLSVTLKDAGPGPRNEIRSAPGFDGVQLPINTKIMPTAMTFLDDGRLAFTSLQGHVYTAKDANGDGVEDSLTLVEDGLAAPYGIIQDGDSLLVSHKPELLRLRDTDGDGRTDERSVFSTGWGYNDNYHDWTCGIVRDNAGNLYVGLGSDYAQRDRPREQARWRGKVLKIAPDGTPSPFSHGFRYPTGLAIDAQGRLFATDNQGVQNTFNEINHLRQGLHYGVPKRYEEELKVDVQPPAIQIPHPWTRSVNGIAILPDDFPIKEFAGHGIGAEYNGKLLIRFTYHEVDGQLQGAAYYLTQPDFADEDANFQGPISVAVSPRGEIYVGSIHDSGWLGGLNTGSIVKLTANGRLPAGIREIQATSNGFEISFTRPVDRAAAAKSSTWSISGYTRVWQGSYATPDSGRYQPKISGVFVSDDGMKVRLEVAPLKTGFVYEINCGLQPDGKPLWPATGHYSLYRIPSGGSGK